MNTFIGVFVLSEMKSDSTATAGPPAKGIQSEVQNIKQQKKQYVYPHKHCNYCGRMIEIKGRDYCFKCRTEHGKEESKIARNKKFKKYFKYYLIFVAIMFVAVIIYSYL
jgi:predicted nucleic acid-binding Zn ribbon protein